MNEFTVPSPILELQAGIYGQTRGVSQRPAQLMTWLLDRRNLEAAWERVRKADGANTPGMDGVICRELATRGDDWLKAIADDLYHGRYRPSEPRWVDIPNGTGRASACSR